MSGSATSTTCRWVAGSMTISRSVAALRTTWRWTWLSGGTSSTTSAMMQA